MRLYKFLISGLLVCSAFFATGQETGIYHQSPDSLDATQSADLEFIVIANFTEVHLVHGFFRSDTTRAYIERPLVRDSQGMYHLVIEPSEFNGDTLYYFIFAQLGDGGWLSAPEPHPKTHPWKIPVIAP